MTVRESAYKQLLFGVSQQSPQDRQDGQLNAQMNMVSDLVAGLRRRPPIEFVNKLPVVINPNTTDPQFHADIIHNRRVIFAAHNSGTNTVGIATVNSDGSFSNTATETSAANWPQATNPMQFTVLDEELHVFNDAKQPSAVQITEAEMSPNAKTHTSLGQGYWWVHTGGYNTRYTLKVELYNGSSLVEAYTHSYDTPNGTLASHVEQASPEYIVEQLRVAFNASFAANNLLVCVVDTSGTVLGITATVDFFNHPDVGDLFINVEVLAGTALSSASGTGVVRDVAQLPPKMPWAEYEGVYNIGVGLTGVPTWYTYRSGVWEEDAYRGPLWENVTKIQDLPMRVVDVNRETATPLAWGFQTTESAFRNAGDVLSNPDPKFVTDGITGMTTFQGRLCFMSNQYVEFSASDKYDTWTRTTLENLLDSDPISIASTANLRDPFRAGQLFDGNLIILSKTQQAQVAGDKTLTPSTASITLKSTYGCDPYTVTNAEQSMFLSSPSVSGYGQVLELTPSQYIVGYDGASITNHIPKYLPDFNLMAADPINRLVVGGEYGTSVVGVYTYLREDRERIHHSWSNWDVGVPVHYMYFEDSYLYMVVDVGGSNPYALVRVWMGADSANIPDGEPHVFLDYMSEGTVVEDPGALVGKWVAVDPDLAALYTDKVETLQVYYGSPPTNQYVLDVQVDSGTTYVQVHPDIPVGFEVHLGLTYLSGFSPTPPIQLDRNEVPILTGSQRVLKYTLTLEDTNRIYYTVGDDSGEYVSDLTTPRLMGEEILIPTDLESDDEIYDGSDNRVVIPARVDLISAKLTVWTTDIHDLKVTDVSYKYRIKQRMGRR